MFRCCFVVVSLLLCVAPWAVASLQSGDPVVQFFVCSNMVSRTFFEIMVRKFVYRIGRRRGWCIAQRRSDDDPPSLRTRVYVFMSNLALVLLVLCWSIGCVSHLSFVGTPFPVIYVFCFCVMLCFEGLGVRLRSFVRCVGFLVVSVSAECICMRHRSRAGANPLITFSIPRKLHC